MSTQPARIEFTLGGYRFLFGPSHLPGDVTFAPPPRDTLCLWRWTGHYWTIEISDCTDLEGAKYALQFILSDEKLDRKTKP